MIIQRLFAEPFCDMKYYETELNNQTAILPAEYAQEILKAISLLLKIKDSPYYNPKIRVPYTRVEADISVKNFTYYIKAEKIGRKIAYFYNSKAENTPEEKNFYYLTRRLPEEDKISFFCGRDADKYPLYFKRYFDAVKNYWTDDYAEATNGLSNTEFFRKRLAEYVDGYVPQPLFKGRGEEIAINENGSFYIEGGSASKENAYLNESLMPYFNFICFLNANEFWQELEQIRDLNHVPLPLFITDIGGGEKNDISIDRYIEKASSLGRQALIFV